MRIQRIIKCIVFMILISSLTPVYGSSTGLDIVINVSNNGPTNEDIILTIEANDALSGIKEIILPDGISINKSSTSYTVTENGSYTFKAVDNAGNKAEKTIEITNIDKNLPTEGEIIILAVDEEDGRTLKTTEDKNLGLGVQIVQAPVIPGYKLTSSPIITIWLKPADNMRKVTFTYKIDHDWKGWEEAERIVDEAEDIVETAEKYPSNKSKDEAQREIDEAKDIVSKLPESDNKDKLNEKLDKVQKRLDKVRIPNYNIDDKIDEESIQEGKEISIPEVDNIPLDKFIARWGGHEVLLEEPLFIAKSKAKLEIDTVQMRNLSNKGLTPRIYKWNEHKEKWIALSTRVDGNAIRSYEDIEGYVGIFAVKQPEFKDVNGTEWYAKIADRANGLGIVEGYSLKDGNVVLRANNTITRSEFYALASRIFGSVREGDNSIYNILESNSLSEAEKILSSTNYIANDWAKPYIATLYENGLIHEIKGYEDLNDNITRIEAMGLLTKLIKEVEAVDTVNLDNFSDSKEIEKYEKLIKNDIEIANIVNGYNDKTLRPNNNMTRIEALTLVINTLEKLGW